MQVAVLLYEMVAVAKPCVNKQAVMCKQHSVTQLCWECCKDGSGQKPTCYTHDLDPIQRCKLFTPQLHGVTKSRQELCQATLRIVMPLLLTIKVQKKCGKEGLNQPCSNKAGQVCNPEYRIKPRSYRLLICRQCEDPVTHSRYDCLQAKLKNCLSDCSFDEGTCHSECKSHIAIHCCSTVTALQGAAPLCFAVTFLVTYPPPV